MSRNNNIEGYALAGDVDSSKGLCGRAKQKKRVLSRLKRPWMHYGVGRVSRANQKDPAARQRRSIQPNLRRTGSFLGIRSALKMNSCGAVVGTIPAAHPRVPTEGLNSEQHL